MSGDTTDGTCPRWTLIHRLNAGRHLPSTLSYEDGPVSCHCSMLGAGEGDPICDLQALGLARASAEAKDCLA